MTRQLTSPVRHKLLRSPHAKRPPRGRLRSSAFLVRKPNTDEMRVWHYFWLAHNPSAILGHWPGHLFHTPLKLRRSYRAFRRSMFLLRNSGSPTRSVSNGVPSRKRRQISAIRCPNRSAVSISPTLGFSSSALLWPMAATQVPRRFRSLRAPPRQLFPGRSLKRWRGSRIFTSVPERRFLRLAIVLLGVLDVSHSVSILKSSLTCRGAVWLQSSRQT
jgi:hypothetical protein